MKPDVPKVRFGEAIRRPGDQVARRSLDFYDAVGRRLADQGGI